MSPKEVQWQDGHGRELGRNGLRWGFLHQGRRGGKSHVPLAEARLPVGAMATDEALEVATGGAVAGLAFIFMGRATSASSSLPAARPRLMLFGGAKDVGRVATGPKNELMMPKFWKKVAIPIEAAAAAEVLPLPLATKAGATDGAAAAALPLPLATKAGATDEAAAAAEELPLVPKADPWAAPLVDVAPVVVTRAI